MWDELGRTGPVFRQPWPEYDPDLAQEEEAEMPVQINGKLRGRIRIPFGATRELSEQRALADDKIQQFLEGKQIVKIIVIPDKLVNIVAK
jgi:leucyl-tRNA synthetase